MLLSTLTTLFAQLLAAFTYEKIDSSSQHSPLLQFELRQYHAVSGTAQVLFHGARTHESLVENSPTTHRIRTRRVRTRRPYSLAAFSNARTRSLLYAESVPIHWDEDDVIGPDLESRETLLELAKMTDNAYLQPGEPGWYDLGANWNVSYPVGWEPDADGFRGHVFATPDNSTVVLSIKGTSAPIVSGGGPTSKKDKFNDNLLFSCCCARVDWTWTTVCDCYREGWKCDQNCLETALIEESLFYSVGIVSMRKSSDAFFWLIERRRFSCDTLRICITT